MNFVRRFLSIRLDWLFIGLIVGFAVCLNSCSAVSTLKGYSSLCLPFALLACLLLLMFTDVEKNNTALTGGLLVFVLPVVFSALANFDNSNVVNSLTLLSCIFLAYLCVRKFGSILMCRIFVKLMCISAAMSLILYLATNLLRLNLPFPVLENVNGIHYKTIFIVSQYAETYIDGSKSMGFFWESGIFASYLLLAIAIEFMVEEKASIRRLALLVIALFTTGSTPTAVPDRRQARTGADHPARGRLLRSAHLPHARHGLQQRTTYLPPRDFVDKAVNGGLAAVLLADRVETVLLAPTNLKSGAKSSW